MERRDPMMFRSGAWPVHRTHSTPPIPVDFPASRTVIPETQTHKKPHENRDIRRLRHVVRVRLYYAPLATPLPQNASHAASLNAA
ncbi:hypothetical protein BCEN4_370167 [Burkholderia cenocepacia]|nr:hypothetical protein BCEN4_370167 [Burkholderia cenocepacia]